jgi:hypothetical protein
MAQYSNQSGNSRNYQNRSGGYQGQVHLHFHAAPQPQQAAPQPAPVTPKPATPSVSLPSAAEIDRQCALIAKTVVTIIVTMWVTMIPYMAIPFAGFAVLYYIQVRQKKAANAAIASNNAQMAQQPALSSANATSVLTNAPVNKQLNVPTRNRLSAPLKRLTKPLLRLSQPLKRLPRP